MMTWFDPDERDKIVYHRNAEVLIPQRLGLEALLAIICRSQAEYQTLLYLLALWHARSRWVDQDKAFGQICGCLITNGLLLIK